MVGENNMSKRKEEIVDAFNHPAPLTESINSYLVGAGGLCPAVIVDAEDYSKRIELRTEIAESPDKPSYLTSMHGEVFYGDLFITEYNFRNFIDRNPGDRHDFFRDMALKTQHECAFSKSALVFYTREQYEVWRDAVAETKGQELLMSSLQEKEPIPFSELFKDTNAPRKPLEAAIAVDALDHNKLIKFWPSIKGNPFPFDGQLSFTEHYDVYINGLHLFYENYGDNEDGKTFWELNNKKIKDLYGFSDLAFYFASDAEYNQWHNIKQVRNNQPVVYPHTFHALHYDKAAETPAKYCPAPRHGDEVQSEISSERSEDYSAGG
jgi:hypothetical protein